MPEVDKPHFSPAEFARRVSGAQRNIRERGLDALLVHTPENIYYLTGHHTPGYYMYQCMLVPAEGAPILLVRRGEVGNAYTYGVIDDKRIYDDNDDPIEATTALVRERNLSSSRIGIETGSWFMPHRTFLALEAALAGAHLSDATAILNEQRSIKSEDELAVMRKSAEITSLAMADGIEAVSAGANDRDIAAAILASLVRNGSDYLAMEPFVAVGSRAGTMHSMWDGRVVRGGDTVLLEVAAAYGRYHTALMHTVGVGQVSPEFRRWSEVTVEALNAAIAAVAPGVTSGEVDEACRSVFERAGLEENFRKRTGYAIGTAFAPDWGEGHIFSLRRDDPRQLQPGMVFHIPPALRTYGRGGVGFSETILVTETGCEVLTKCNRALTLV